MTDLKILLDNKGQEYKIEFEKDAENSFPLYLNRICRDLNISKEINETEEDGFPIISILKLFYKTGYYAGAQFALNDHSDIEEERFNF